jgi:hypothetical protein
MLRDYIRHLREEVHKDEPENKKIDTVVIGAGFPERHTGRELNAVSWPDPDRPKPNLGIEFTALERRIEELEKRIEKIENFLILD